MSIAGIRSNRGDLYQTLVAFDWALTVLSDTAYQWLEIDSALYSVDDVVIGKTDGSLICCQCKKNQPDFKYWTIANLYGELEKASLLLVNHSNAEVRFYSRSPFSALAKLREYSTTQADKVSYCSSLGKEQKKIDSNLESCLSTHAPTLSTYDFLRRTKFETSPELDRMETLLHERLRQMVSNSKAAFNALYTRLDQLGGRMEGGNESVSTQHRLSKNDLKLVLQQAGAMLVPIVDIAEVRASFTSISAIGRAWHRDISGEHIPSSTVNELLVAIDGGNRSILLTGQPGSGKTCVVLDLQQALEQRAQTQADFMPLFIQSREFADLATAQERQAQGLSAQWVEQAARMAENGRVVVVIDSLDVLSIAREHSILQYFLAQIDRLLLIPNITVVTACRDFDRNYDRRIAKRQWDCELKCKPLDWNAEIVPLLDKLGIETAGIDNITRELISNPRELALFVELAQHEGSFNVVTNQALAQRYLDSIVRSDPDLGDAAMQAIEAIADEMLQSRSLSIPYQRFSTSQDTLRKLLSLNILKETHDGNLTFGHQTLLDVLVISGAVRRGITLNEFIQGLPPVPFVRPSIRSFVAQVASNNRRDFRRQVRAVLTGSAAFHIRRLVAESFAEQRPHDDDWPLIRDLRNHHREVFQVIYQQAKLIEWHHFWFVHLVPVLKDEQDTEGLTAHIYRVEAWLNEDTTGVVAFWMEALSLDWLDVNRIVEQIGFRLSDISTENLPLVAPLLEQLLTLPQPDHSSLGKAIARCVAVGAMDDNLLWDYIVGDINEDDVMKSHFDNKLRCQPHEFGDKNDDFLPQRMVQSNALLDMALEAIEQWSQIKSEHYGETREGYRYGYLGETSYNDVHSQYEFIHKDSERFLLDAIELAIFYHSEKKSDWWRCNRECLCLHHEGALCYFAILACTNFPESNIDLIGRMLCDKNLLEFELTYELGALIKSGFIYLDSLTQSEVTKVILNVWGDREGNEFNISWILEHRAVFISTIPCHLRSSEAQMLLNTYEEREGSLISKPKIHSWGGTVRAPFSFEEFLKTSDNGVIRLLAHYTGYNEGHGSDFLIGGERQVGGQLSEAASRQPNRFLQLLSTRWLDISKRFRDDLMDGVANFLRYRHGDLQSNGAWEPIEEPDAPALASYILEELENHPGHWQHKRSASNALQACAHVIQNSQNAARLVFLAIGFANIREESAISGDSIDLLSQGINMTTGHVTEALMILANNFQEHGILFPELLPPTLNRFAKIEHPAIRALILRRLPYLQSMLPVLGWDIFYLAMHDSRGLWRIAEPCLYYAYFKQFEKVNPLLARICKEGIGDDFETWGRISALASLTGHVDFAVFLEDLKALNAAEAWSGAASVWTHTENIKQHREQCLVGIEAGLSAASPHALAVAQRVENIFQSDKSPIAIPIKLLRLCFTVFEGDSENKHHRLFSFNEWLNAIAQRDPEKALAASEIYLDYVRTSRPYFHDHNNNLTQMMTRLFGEAEEREESDQGAMLKRVVSIQDTLLSLGNC